MPMLGDIAAGTLTEAIEQGERFDFDDWFRHKNQFALRVKGDSMIEAGINDGDVVICRRARSATRGDIVVCSDRRGRGHAQILVSRSQPRATTACQQADEAHLLPKRPDPRSGNRCRPQDSLATAG